MAETKAPPPAAPKASAPPPPPASKPLGPPPNLPGMKLTENKGGITRGWVIERGPTNKRGELICLYGVGGIGKSTLASYAPDPLFIDVNDGTTKMDVARVSGIKTWLEMLSVIQDEALVDPFKTIVLDTLTDAEHLAVDHTIATVPHEKGKPIVSIEDYGFGKGLQHVYETFYGLLPAIHKLASSGKNVVLIAHDCLATVPNPDGADWLRWEPLLQHPNSGKSSIRLLIQNTVDHLIRIGYDVSVKDGKGRGSGTRTIYPCAQASFMAKSRSLREPLPFEEGDATFWNLILGGK